MTAPATTPDPGAAETPTPGALSKLIQDANDRGLSYQEMADRAVHSETGTRYYKQSLQKLVKKFGFTVDSVVSAAVEQVKNAKG